MFVQGAAGVNVNGGDSNQSVAVGVSLADRFDLLLSGERTHKPTETTGTGVTRGGTTRMLSGEARFFPIVTERVSPYVLASVGRGISRPNVNDMFPERVTNDAWVFLAGGGARVALGRRVDLFADVRAGILGERDVIVLIVPIRGGMAVRF
ncbi:MAG: hypothetical protein IT178_16195 [Acidobacteria bacterium]|nr:hypothetical protein [Acidobacteriota bacterium]